MNPKSFAKIAESLRQYRRAELRDFESDLGTSPVEQLYVDPLPGDAILTSVLSGNTTFLLGRKGTGKSTVFAKAQAAFREQKNIITVYLDVKSICDILTTASITQSQADKHNISLLTYQSHLLRKTMLGKIISELLKEVRGACEKMSIWDRWSSHRKQYHDLLDNLQSLGDRVKNIKLENHEVPVLQEISRQVASQQQHEQSTSATLKANSGASVGIKSATLSTSVEGAQSDFDRALDELQVYETYSDIVMKSFPFEEIIEEIRSLLQEAKLTRLVVFFDDFSELKLIEQRLFVDIILSPLNNSSDETIKLKIAGYPGRVYYGRIDPGKTDTIGLDFSDLYEATEVQEMERSASNYASRLLGKRFSSFGLKLEDYFDMSAGTTDEYMGLIFRASFNVPRIMGHILHQCYLDRVSKELKITPSSIRLAAKKQYENTTSKYFDRLNRYALEPFENKLDRNNQELLLTHLITEARDIRKKITNNEVGGKYFESLGGNPPVSHFIVTPELESMLSSLESNFFLSRYKKTRDKEGRHVIVYALFMGLTESERFAWGYPEGRPFRNYFVQRCFDYSRAVHEFLSSSQTIKCKKCAHCHPMSNKKSIELYGWRCPECLEGICSIANLSDDFKKEIEQLDKGIMLDPVELEIITTLKDEERAMRAGEIAVLIDVTHQLVGRRTSKLKEMGLVEKTSDEQGRMQSSITTRCIKTYF